MVCRILPLSSPVLEHDRAAQAALTCQRQVYVIHAHKRVIIGINHKVRAQADKVSKDISKPKLLNKKSASAQTLRTHD